MKGTTYCIVPYTKLTELNSDEFTWLENKKLQNSSGFSMLSKATHIALLWGRVEGPHK